MLLDVQGIILSLHLIVLAFFPRVSAHGLDRTPPPEDILTPVGYSAQGSNLLGILLLGKAIR